MKRIFTRMAVCTAAMLSLSVLPAHADDVVVRHSFSHCLGALERAETAAGLPLTSVSVGSAVLWGTEGMSRRPMEHRQPAADFARSDSTCFHGAFSETCISSGERPGHSLQSGLRGTFVAGPHISYDNAPGHVAAVLHSR